mmetsp:Transcript_13351/g.37969  ORF Transcript_13351/g.37969 Transcript_13351/m.37969 type:complete len:425 (+) Transcript_13351:56-1330(+)
MNEIIILLGTRSRVLVRDVRQAGEHPDLEKVQNTVTVVPVGIRRIGVAVANVGTDGDGYAPGAVQRNSAIVGNGVLKLHVVLMASGGDSQELHNECTLGGRNNELVVVVAEGIPVEILPGRSGIHSKPTIGDRNCAYEDPDLIVIQQPVAVGVPGFVHGGTDVGFNVHVGRWGTVRRVVVHNEADLCLVASADILGGLDLDIQDTLRMGQRGETEVAGRNVFPTNHGGGRRRDVVHNGLLLHCRVVGGRHRRRAGEGVNLICIERGITTLEYRVRSAVAYTGYGDLNILNRRRAIREGHRVRERNHFAILCRLAVLHELHDHGGVPDGYHQLILRRVNRGPVRVVPVELHLVDELISIVTRVGRHAREYPHLTNVHQAVLQVIITRKGQEVDGGALGVRQVRNVSGCTVIAGVSHQVREGHIIA